MLFLKIFLLLSISLGALAEYRVFELEITAYSEVDPTIPSGQTPLSPPEELGKRVELSTLDPEQYRGYHTVKPNEHVRYIATWRCPGRTANKDYCPNPKVKTEETSAAVPSENK